MDLRQYTEYLKLFLHLFSWPKIQVEELTDPGSPDERPRANRKQSTGKKRRITRDGTRERDGGVAESSRANLTMEQNINGKRDKPIKKKTEGNGIEHIRAVPVVSDTAGLENPVNSTPDTTPTVTHPTASPVDVVDSTNEVNMAMDTNLDNLCCKLYDPRAQKLIDRYQLGWGVQYEIARGVSEGLWEWNEITEAVVAQLRGTNAEAAPLVAPIILEKKPFVTERQRLIHSEFDREELAIREGKDRGLGLMGAWQGVENWYGGRIQQQARLEKGTKPNEYTLRLEELTHIRSFRLARYVGSASVLQVKVDKALSYDDDKARGVLSRSLVFCGRTFVPIHAKDDKAYFVQCKPTGSAPLLNMVNPPRHTFQELLNWFNPLRTDDTQPVSKWSARWQLVFSTSVPAVEFTRDNIHFIPDLYAIDPESGKENGKELMTDGCGFMNKSGLVLIARLMGDKFPCVVQGRLAGNKGIWILHPDTREHNLDDPPKVWIRNSQVKVKMPPDDLLDRSHLIFDLVRLPRLTTPSSLNQQCIINLAHNGVEHDVFAQLLEAGLKAEIQPLTNWECKDVSVHLAKAVQEAGSLLRMRVARCTALSARARGFIRDDNQDDERRLPDSDNENLVQRDPGGQPSLLFESTRELLQAGFSPLRLPILCHKMTFVIKEVVKSYMEKYHIGLPLSAEMFIIPDPVGVLNEGEIYIRSSKEIGDPMESTDPFTFLGDVLIWRNPMRVASDIQKVKAVTHDSLLPYRDVIICSTKGFRSLATYLGGGDFDGDTGVVCANQLVVKGFKNASFVAEPEGLSENFEEYIQQVKSFRSELQDMDKENADRTLFRVLLQNLSDNLIGLYSNFHEVSMYERGYDDENTVRLAYMFTTCLDSSKTGKRVKLKVLRQDNKLYSIEMPRCFRPSDEPVDHRWGMKRLAKRERSLGIFVLDSLLTSAKKLRDIYVAENDQLSRMVDRRRDTELLAGLQRVEAYAKKDKDIAEFIERVRTHVNTCLCDFVFGVDGRTGKARGFIVSEVVAKYHETIEGEEIMPFDVSRVKAAIAYESSCDPPRGSYIKAESNSASEFPFAVAFSELCEMKASEGGLVSMTRRVADFSLIQASLVRASLVENEELVKS